MTMFFHVGLLKVHEDRPFIHLDDTILQSGPDAQFLCFYMEDDIGQ